MQIWRCFVEIQIFLVCPVFRFHAIKEPFVLFVQGFSKQLNDVNRERVLGEMQSSQSNNPTEVSYVLSERTAVHFNCVPPTNKPEFLFK